MYEGDGLAEVFIRMAKQGSTLAGLLDAFAISISMALQYGVPFKDLARKFIYARFEPSGFTENPQVRIATSIVDYIFRYLALRLLAPEDLAEFGMTGTTHDEEGSAAPYMPDAELPEVEKPKILKNGNGFTPADTVCRNCGGMMVRTGTCLTCLQCGNASGGCS